MFNQDSRKVYAHFNALCKEDEDRSKYQNSTSSDAGSEHTFENIEEASSFWIELCESRGTGNKDIEWLSRIKEAIARKVPTSSEDPWTLKCSDAVKCLLKKRNWSAPGPDHLINYWWKRAA